MKLLKNNAFIHRFEDYNIVCTPETCLFATWGFYIPYDYDRSTCTYIINKDLPVKVKSVTHPTYSWINSVDFSPEIAVNHKELLDTAKKLFVHSSCKLSRSLVGGKYKKSLNPFLSDAIVVPKPNYSDIHIRNYALFINEDAKLIVMVCVTETKSQDRIKSVCDSTKFKDVITCNPDDTYACAKKYKTSDMLEAELFYYGEVICVPNDQSWIAEILTNRIPADKIVFEDTVQKSLKDETNQLDLDSLCSIKDMLESSDDNTVSAGLKSLSMMDWVHYPNSIKFILKGVTNHQWRYNPACNSTSVKYMLRSICTTAKRGCWPGDFDPKIYEQDYELFKQLKIHYENVPQDNIMSYMRYYDFMMCDSNGTIIPFLIYE